MKKKILISVIVIIVVIVGALAYLNNRNRTLSPPGKAELKNGDLIVSIPYSRPSVRNRVIFGTKEQKALQPYGEYWRLGANESTEITFNKNVFVGSKPLAAGTYRIYAIPGPETFFLVFNTELGVWGVFDPDPKEDILRITVPVEKSDAVTEQFTITMSAAGDTTNVNFAWEHVKFTLPVRQD